MHAIEIADSHFTILQRDESLMIERNTAVATRVSDPELLLL